MLPPEFAARPARACWVRRPFPAIPIPTTGVGQKEARGVMRRELGELSDVAAVEALLSAAGLSLAGLSVVDVGCGAGASSRELAARGASVLAVEPDPVQAAKNRAAPPSQGVGFAETGAESQPAEPGAMAGRAVDVAHVHNELGRLMLAQGRGRGAAEPHLTALEILCAKPAESQSVGHRLELARTYDLIGSALTWSPPMEWPMAT